MLPYPDVLVGLVVADPAAALDFYARAFGAVELFRWPDGDTIGHAEFRIGGTRLTLGPETPASGCVGPRAAGSASATLTLFADDVEAAFARAVKAGATVRQEPVEEPWGGRGGWLGDPFGHIWYVASRPPAAA